MIFFSRNWAGSSWVDRDRAAASLAAFVPQSADCEDDGANFFAELAPAASPHRRIWRVARLPSGMAALLSGWIDNHAELAARLGRDPSEAPGLLYAAAVERWGDEADRQIVGTYSAVVAMPDGTVRLSRSPWDSRSLYFHADGDVLMAASLPRPMFAAGLPRQLRRSAVDEMLRLEMLPNNVSFFEHIESVGPGSILIAGRDSRREVRWYDPHAIAPVRFGRDEDYVEAANALLAEAAACALRPAAKPGISLSGGLDSSMVCDEILRQLPPDQRLPSFTFHPLAQWDGKLASHKFADDRPYVDAFAAMHPRLDTTYVDNAGIGFDDRAEQIFAACDIGHPSGVLGAVYHGVYDAARKQGCDWLFSAGLGNMTFSSTAPWAMGEFLRQGKLRQLWRLAAGRLNDPRSVPRRILAEAVLPQLPQNLQTRIRAMVHPGRLTEAFANPFLKADGRLGHKQWPLRADRSAMMDGDGASRRGYIEMCYQAMGAGGEMLHGCEQVFGLKLRDVTAYRPLIEFCFAIPTEQFVRDGETRLLARRMGIGRMPEAQRTNRLYGAHNADFLARLTPRVPEMRQRVEAIARHPDLGLVVDTDRMLATLDNWPTSTPDDPDHAIRLRFFLPAVLYVARYVDFISGRNQG